jgi:hypothetical protein
VLDGGRLFDKRRRLWWEILTMLMRFWIVKRREKKNIIKGRSNEN